MIPFPVTRLTLNQCNVIKHLYSVAQNQEHSRQASVPGTANKKILRHLWSSEGERG